MNKYTPAEKAYIEVLKRVAKGSRKYSSVANLPLMYDAKVILKGLGFKGKYLN